MNKQDMGPFPIPVEPAGKSVSMGEDINNESTYRSQSNQYNALTTSKQLIHEEYNSGRNLAPIMKMIDEGRARDLDDEPKVDKKPVLIIGSGPSFDYAVEHLKEWRGGIICSPSHALTLMYHGIEPTHIVALDPFESWDEIEGVDWSKTRTKLVTHPGVMPSLFEKWPNDILLYRQSLGRSDSFYATTQLHQYSWRSGTREKGEFKWMIRTEVIVFACSTPLQLFVSDRLGYGIPFMVGADFGYHSGKARFTSYTVKEPSKLVAVGNAPAVDIPIQWERHEHPFVMPEKGSTEYDDTVRTNNGQLTSRVLLFYKKNTISAWRLLERTCYTTDHGTITEMPYMDIGKVVRTQGRAAKERSKGWNLRAADRYLASIGAFVLVTKANGKNFIEVTDPISDLSRYMVEMMKNVACGNCGLTGKIEREAGDDVEAQIAQQACPRCGMKEMKRANEYDMGENLTRIALLLEWVKKHKAELATDPV